MLNSHNKAFKRNKNSGLRFSTHFNPLFYPLNAALTQKEARDVEAEILKVPPTSGQYEEHDFTDSGNTVWVKFFDSDWVELCGVFSLGWCSQSSVHRIPGGNQFLVVSGGQGHIIDVDARKLIHKTETDQIEAVIFNEHCSRFVVTDGLGIGVLENSEVLWCTNRISLDGITFQESNGHLINGTLNDMTDEGCSFTFDVASHQ